MGGGAPLSLVDASKNPEVKRCRNAFLPETCTLRSWVDRRIGGEVEVSKDDKGRFTLQLRSEGGDTAENGGAPTAEDVDAWFATLPDDGFTPDEEGLREALLAMLQNSRGQGAPTLTEAESNSRVRKHRAGALPDGCPASLGDWIDRRIGGEIEMLEAPNGSGQVHFGLRGELEAQMKRGNNKRPGNQSGGPPAKRR